MPEYSKDVRCFQLTIFLSSDNPVVGPIFFTAAGDNHDEVVHQPPRFQTTSLLRGKTVCTQLLRKLAQAVDDGSETVRIVVDDAGFIVPDPEPPVIVAPAIPTPKPTRAKAKTRAKASKVSPKTAKTSTKKKSELKKSTPDKKKTEPKKQADTKKTAATKKKAETKKQGETKKKASPGRKNKKPDRNR